LRLSFQRFFSLPQLRTPCERLHAEAAEGKYTAELDQTVTIMYQLRRLIKLDTKFSDKEYIYLYTDSLVAQRNAR
jgi:hypothetical protein